ncbi:MAG: UDP-glucose 4-epimerase GalE [Myxococcales bacterium]|nr:UDP-glucose 4-epimerase GalE [Myxococcales bacterium]
MTRALVTGGAGYVGSHTVRHLLTAGCEVVILDDLSTGHAESIPQGIELLNVDLRDRRAMRDSLQGRRFDAVLHFAARSLVGESMQKPYEYLRDNFAGALNLIEWCSEVGVERFVLSSTANLFGNGGQEPIAETDEIAPGSPYGESKFLIERALAWAERIHGMRYACLRYFNAAGALEDGSIGEHHDPETHLIPIVLQVALGQRDRVTVFGDDYETRDGTCIRDYIHVSDLATAHVAAVERLGDRSLALNLGNGSGFSVLEVLEMARKVTGHRIPHVLGERRPGDPATLVACSERAKELLGWAPKHDLDAIVGHAWAWHSKHPHGFKS